MDQKQTCQSPEVNYHMEKISNGFFSYFVLGTFPPGCYMLYTLHYRKSELLPYLEAPFYYTTQTGRSSPPNDLLKLSDHKICSPRHKQGMSVVVQDCKPGRMLYLYRLVQALLIGQIIHEFDGSGSTYSKSWGSGPQVPFFMEAWSNQLLVSWLHFGEQLQLASCSSPKNCFAKLKLKTVEQIWTCSFCLWCCLAVEFMFNSSQASALAGLLSLVEPMCNAIAHLSAPGRNLHIVPGSSDHLEIKKCVSLHFMSILVSLGLTEIFASGLRRLEGQLPPESLPNRHLFKCYMSWFLQNS